MILKMKCYQAICDVKAATHAISYPQLHLYLLLHLNEMIMNAITCMYYLSVYLCVKVCAFNINLYENNVIAS